MGKDTPLSPADLADSVIQTPQVIHTAEVVLGEWGRHFSTGFEYLRETAKQRSRTDAYNVLIEAEKLVLHWVRTHDSRCAWHRAEDAQPEWKPGRKPGQYQPKSSSEVGITPAVKTGQED